MSEKQLRVLILGLHYLPETTGNAPYTTSLAEGLRQRGFNVRVITGHPHYPGWLVRDGYGQWKRTETVRGVPVVRLRHYVPKAPAPWKRLASEISFGLRLIFTRWGKPDIVLLVSPALFASALAAMKSTFLFRKTLLSVWVQDLYALGINETASASRITAKLVGAVEAAMLRAADGVAVIHDRFRVHLVDRLGVDPEKTEVIRNWSHVKGTAQGDRSVRRRLGWSPDETIALHAGNMGAKQGLENVVAAARLADEIGANVKFVLLGDGNQRLRLERLAQGAHRIQFIDPLPGELFEEALAAANVLLVNELPGVTEMSVPSKLTSYFSTGRPVVAATDRGSVTHHEIESSGGGTRVDSAAPDQLVAEVLRLAGDRELSVDLGRSGLRYRERMLGQEAALDRYAGWLRSLAEKRGRAAGAPLPDKLRGNA